ncbi:ribonuclease III [Thioalkalivibrio denitrificans]|uniref:Ribonuclease 3 n=1 Tax=Thioalkalivibrio denitrificans TaxID=108003 RepID=A0A1V3NQ97_9GAMM|nr:ribonuclease III [Thioalkalivibrio denitrificans]OOG27211.1 ribonuclease III [Thioalkalivibrio denitrificans]
MSGTSLLDLLPDGLRNSELLEEALTHRSAAARNNERLEYLGDAVLGMIVAEQLYRSRPDVTEGDLSRLRSALVDKDSLAAIGSEWGLERYISVGPGELKSGGSRRRSILADAVEALIGAVYLYSGFDAAREFVLCLYRERLANLPDADALKDPKTRLQEWLQARNLDLPVYEVESISGKAHAQHFRALCRIESAGVEACGEGSSRRRAEQAAAQCALEALKG